MSVEDVEALKQLVADMNSRLKQQEATAKKIIEDANEQVGNLIKKVKSLEETAEMRKKRFPLHESKAISQVTKLGNDKNIFDGWLQETRSIIEPNWSLAAGELSKAAKDPNVPIMFADQPEDERKQWNRELYSFLILVTQSNTTARDIITKANEIEYGGNGLWAWQLLHARFNPDNETTAFAKLNAIMNPIQTKNVNEVLAAIDKWEAKIRHLSATNQANLTDAIKKNLIIKILPNNMAEWIFKTAEHHQTYEKTKAEVVRMVDMELMKSKAAPMELGPVDQQGQEEGEAEDAEINAMGSKGKGKGKGKGPCWTCGQTGHQAWQCPKGKGKGDKGGSSKGPGKGQPWHQQQHWQQQAQSWWWPKGKGKGVSSMDQYYGDYDSQQYFNYQQWPMPQAQPMLANGNASRSIGCVDQIIIKKAPKIQVEKPIEVKNSFNALHNENEDYDDDQETERLKEYLDNQRKIKELDTEIQGITEKVEEAEQKANPWRRARSKKKVKFMRSSPCKDSCCLDVHEGRIGSIHPDIGVIDAMGKWEALKDGITIDSGAAENVMPKKCCERFEVKESEGSRLGVHYVAANGDLMPNEGERKVEFVTDHGEQLNMTFQVSDSIRKPLGAVSKICSKGNVVVFDDAGSYILNKQSGNYTPIEQRNGVYVVDAWLFQPHSVGFAGRGQ